MQSKKMVKRVLIVAVTILLLVYFGFQIYNSTYTQIKTETASYMELSDAIDATGFAVRDETVLTSDASGVLTYLLQDGERVSKGGKVAELYTNSADVSNQKSIENLKSEIEQLKQLAIASEAFTSPESLDKQIQQSLKDLLIAANGEDYSKLSSQKENLLYQLNERQIITKKVKNFDGRIQQLQSELDSLQAKHSESIGNVTSPVSGYFVSGLDGFENLLSYQEVLDLTPEQIDAGIKAEPSPMPENAVGKVIGGLNWYMVCNISAQDAVKLRVGKPGITLNMPFASTESVPVSIVAVNQKDKDSPAAVILKCSYMSEELANIRSEEIQINAETHQGIRISKKAVHMDTVSRVKRDEKGDPILDANGKKVMEEKEVQGVYVVYGGELVFKEIVVEYSSDNYVICNPSPGEDELFSGKTVQLYDEVVVEGTDLRDGRVVK